MKIKYKNSSLLLVLLLALLVQTTVVAQELSTIVQSANTFLKTLKEEQLKKVNLNFSDSLRLKWSNFPIGFVTRPGIKYGELSENSRIAFHDLLSSILTSKGYLKITGIMQLDDILNIISPQDITEKMKWGYENYFIAIWGSPNEKNPWGFTLGGHHMALNLTMCGKEISFTPLFVGTDPAQIQKSKYAGWRVLSKEEDYGFLLLNFLSQEQKAKAIFAKAVPRDIITNPSSSQRITSYYGLPVKELNKDQLEVFKILIQEYLHNFEHSVSHTLYEKIEKNGFDNIYFGWVGGTERHTPHYYIVNAPDFLIEYDNVGFQNDGNHIHAILREKNNDFGRDILKDHYLNSEHHKK